MENTVKRWTAKQKVEILLIIIIIELLKGETTIVDGCSKNDLKQFEVE
jgi:hypothetical protein